MTVQEANEGNSKAMNIWFKVALAAVSGIAAWVLTRVGVGSDSNVAPVILIGVSGLVFAAGVLFPYLRRDRRIIFRASALIIVSSLSYWVALRIVKGLDSGFFPTIPGTDEFILGSIAGTLIVLVGARYIIPLYHSLQLVLTGIVAAICGGLLFAAPPLWGTKEDSFILAYAAWHVLLALAIHFGENLVWLAGSDEPGKF